MAAKVVVEQWYIADSSCGDNGDAGGETGSVCSQTGNSDIHAGIIANDDCGSVNLAVILMLQAWFLQGG